MLWREDLWVCVGQTKEWPTNERIVYKCMWPYQLGRWFSGKAFGEHEHNLCCCSSLVLFCIAYMIEVDDAQDRQ